MELSPGSPSFLSDDELQQFMSELLSWDEQAPAATSCSLSPLHYIGIDDVCDPAPPPFSPTFIPPSSAILSKRDWLSSFSPSPSLPPPPPHRRVLSSLADAYVFTSSSHSLSARPSSSSTTIKHLSHCTSLPSTSTNPLNLHLSHTHIRQSNLEASGNKHRNHDAVRGVAFCLSDVKAALQAHLSDSVALLNEVEQLDRITMKASDSQPALSPGVDAVRSVAFRISDVKAALQAHLLDSDGTVSDEARQKATLRKAHDRASGKLLASSNRASNMICKQRERQRGMNGLYRELDSLLPHTSTHKVNKCLMLSKTIEYIKSLQLQLNELERQKEQALTKKKKREYINGTEVDATSKKSQRFTNKNFASTNSSRHVEIENDSRTFATNCESTKKVITQGTFKASHDGDLKRCSKAKGGVPIPKNTERPKLSGLNNNVKLNTSIHTNYSVAKCFDVRNEEESPIESRAARTNVCMKFLGEDSLVSICTPKRRGVWSRLLAILEQYGICALNVTLSSGLDFYHHLIIAKVSSTFKLSNSNLQQRIIEFATKA